MTNPPMQQPRESLVGRLAAAVQEVAPAGEPGLLWAVGGPEIEEILGLVGVLRAACERLEVSTVREGIDRGLPGGGGMGVHDWVRLAETRSAPQPEAGHVARVVLLAQASGHPAARSVVSAFDQGVLALSKADQLVRFEREVSPVAAADEVEGALALLVRAASDEPASRGLTSRELKRAIRYAAAHLKPERDRIHEEESQRRGRALFKGPGPAGMSEYRLLADPEAAAVIDAAVSALSAPVKEPDGSIDMRRPARRRADALIDVIARGVSAPGKGPRVDKAQIVVTMTLEALLGQVRGAGVTMSGEVFSAETVRRMACDAGIVPIVLGAQAEVLDVGRVERLFTAAQRKALWRRDGGCSYPGCTIPAQWCEAHHVVWWRNGGKTDLSNAALLCRRHHTHVHGNELTAPLTRRG